MKLTTLYPILFLFFANFTFAGESESPRIYGKIVKECRYIDQDQKSSDGQERRKSTGIVDVVGAESRMGIKGGYEDDLVDLSYVIELGLRTSTPASDAEGEGENIRIRQANVGASGKFGELTVGRHNIFGVVAILYYDPMEGTGFQGGENDAEDIAYSAGYTNSHAGLGYVLMGREEAISYLSPKFIGFQYGISTWHNRDMNSLDRGAGDRIYGQSHLLTFRHKFNDISLNAMINYYMTDQEGRLGDQEDFFYNAAISLEYNNLTISFIKSLYNEGQECVDTAGTLRSTSPEVCDATYRLSDVDNDVSKMLIGLKYRYNDWSFMFSYLAATDEDSDEGDVATTATTSAPAKAKYSQMALGAGYNFNKYVVARILCGRYETDLPEYTNGTPSRDNKADTLIGHVTLMF